MITKRFYSEVNKLNDILELSIEPLTICNQKCEYCYARKDRKNWNKIWSESQLKIVLDKIKNINESFKLEILGGEPTLYPYLNNIINEMDNCERCKEIKLTTNGSIDLTKFKKSKKILYVISVHPNNIKNEINLFKNIEFVKHYNHDILIMLLNRNSEDVNLVNAYIDKVKTITDKISLSVILHDPHYSQNFDFNAFHNFHDVDEKFVLEHDGIKEIYDVDEVIHKDIAHFKGWNCYIKNILISVDGSISLGCKTNIANIFENKTKICSQMVKCDMDKCDSWCWYWFVKTYEN